MLPKTIFTCLLSVALLSAAAQQRAPSTERPLYRMTLEDCLHYAMGNSYTRQTVLLSEESREEYYEQARRNRLPSLDASLGETLSHTNGNEAVWSGNYGINTSVTVFQGGSINAAIEQNRLLLEQTEYQTERYDNELTIQILEAFLTALGNEELLKYQRTLVEASREQLRQGEVQYEVGSILESDYMLLEAQYASDMNNIVESEINRNNSLLALKTLMSMDPQVNIEIVYPDTTTIAAMADLPGEEYVLDRAMETLPDLDISRYNVDIAETNLRIARSSLLPTVSVGGSLGTGHSNFNPGYGTQLNNRLNEQVGVSVSIPIFNRGQARSQVTQNRIALRQAELEDMQTDLDIRQTVIQQYRNVVSSLNRYEATTLSEQAYKRTFDVYRAMFEVGSITAVELLQQQNNYINALNDYIQSKYGFILRRKILDVYMGEPVTM